MQRRIFGAEDPLVLALFRIAVCAVVLISRDTHEAVRFGGYPASLRVPPAFWVDVPVTPLLARVAYVLVLSGALAGLVGWYGRIGCGVAAVAGVYLYGLPQLAGTVLHDHHLVWFLALLAASPCTDVLSIDADDRGGPRPLPSNAYGVPLQLARILVGVIFFFPGLWKLRASGLAWITTDNLRNQMWWKWFELGWVPKVRIDQHPLLCKVLAGGTVAFELSFVWLVLFRPLRRWAALVALLFHASIEALMRIPFSSLWLCYVMFVDVPVREEVRGEWRPAAVVGGALVIVNSIVGFAGITNGWPFACYPTFQWMVGSEITGLLVEGVRADGSRSVLLRSPRGGEQRTWGVHWALLGLTTAYDEAKLRDYVRREVAATPDVVRVEVMQAWWSVAPEDREKQPLRTRVLFTL